MDRVKVGRPNQIVGEPAEMFVHRNVANVVAHTGGLAAEAPALLLAMTE